MYRVVAKGIFTGEQFYLVDNCTEKEAWRCYYSNRYSPFLSALWVEKAA